MLHYLDLFDQLGLEEISLAGLSMGGLIATTLAIQQPQRVRRLVLAAPFGLRDDDHPTVDFFSIPDEEVLSYLFADLSIFEGAPPPTPEFLADRAREAESSFARVAWRAALRPKLRKWLHRVAAPTLILWGEADRLIPVGQAAVWAGLIRGSEARTFAGAPHLLFNESPDAVAATGAFMAVDA